MSNLTDWIDVKEGVYLGKHAISSRIYMLRDWIDVERLNYYLSGNVRAADYLQKNVHLIDDEYIFLNEDAIDIIQRRISNDFYQIVCKNKNAIHFLRNNPQYIQYDILCQYEHGIEFVDELIKNNELDKIDWYGLSQNPAAMHILNDPKYYTCIDWCAILYNKNAGELVRNNIYMVIKYWKDICAQPHLIDIIEKMDNLDMELLSGNENAIHILENNIDTINISNLCYNKNGFSLLLRIGHNFKDDHYYHENVIFEYFDYCEKNNIRFTIIHNLSRCAYTEKHFECLKNNRKNIAYGHLSLNQNIFEYDYEHMRKTRQSLPWYNDIQKTFFL